MRLKISKNGAKERKIKRYLKAKNFQQILNITLKMHMSKSRSPTKYEFTELL